MRLKITKITYNTRNTNKLRLLYTYVYRKAFDKFCSTLMKHSSMTLLFTYAKLTTQFVPNLQKSKTKRNSRNRSLITANNVNSRIHYRTYTMDLVNISRSMRLSKYHLINIRPTQSVTYVYVCLLGMLNGELFVVNFTHQPNLIPCLCGMV